MNRPLFSPKKGEIPIAIKSPNGAPLDDVPGCLEA